MYKNEVHCNLMENICESKKHPVHNSIKPFRALLPYDKKGSDEYPSARWYASQHGWSLSAASSLVRQISSCAIQCSACFWYDRSSHCRVFGGSISCGQSRIEARQNTAYLTPKRHAFHLPNPIILCKCKVCYSLVAYWKLATLRGSNRLVHILSDIAVLSSSFSSPCTLFWCKVQSLLCW
jgi:hypothetical protein